MVIAVNADRIVMGIVRPIKRNAIMKPTGKYANCKHWDAIIEAAKLRPRLSNLIKTYERTGHPGCLNAIMDNADANLWLTYHTGRIIRP